ncbi:dynamin family protein [Ureibacillus manganicus]|uniref:dynamin family protein n=1 Tax=Ureibacillus manganicus TaxID=1266064 RepID=UPI0009DEFEC4|nr:dynamin family protein [Ureibacillus manganicus]
MTLLAPYDSQLASDFQLLKNITRANTDTTLSVDLTKLEKMIQEELPEKIEQLAPPNFPELYFDFKAEFEKLRDFILYEPLIGKHVVALGGGFSSGKSTFLNTLLGTKILPAKIDPSTSVPTYIVHHEKTAVQGINVFDAKMDLQVDDLKAIAHGFGRIEDDDETILEDEITLGHILKNLFLQIPEQTFQNIAFLDTPGYSKSDMTSYSAKTDEKIARSQLNTADYILWFVPADGGTITEQDIAFIKTLYAEIPICFIVNKADKKTDEDLAEIIDKIKKLLDLKGIRYIDVLAFSRSKKQEYDKEKIINQLNSWNEAVYEESFAYHFKKLFVGCREYYDEQITEENRRLNRLNKALTLATDDIQDYLTSLVAEIKNRLQVLKDTGQKLKKLQDDFFSELKRVADYFGIQIPEPEEIDLLQDKIQDAMKIIKEYKEQHQLKPKYDVESILRSTFTNVKPVFFNQKGQGRYKQVLQKVLEEQLDISPEEVKFHSYFDRKAKLIDKVKSLQQTDKRFYKDNKQSMKDKAIHLLEESN